MALLNPAARERRIAAPAEVRLNWRLLLCLAATLAFWIAVARAVRLV